MDTQGIDLLPALRELYGDVPPEATLTRLRGDASTRTYYRVTVHAAPSDKPSSLIVMHLSADALKSDEGQSGGRPAELPFLDVQRLLASRGVPVPMVYVADVPRRVLLLQDLGDETFEARLRSRGEAAWASLYGHAVDLLARMLRACAEPSPSSVAYSRRFDEKLLRWELDHFREWGLEAVHGPLTPPERTLLDGIFERLAAEIARLPTGFVHRDFQSRNLMWVGDVLYIIDFQDAFVGPAVYDAVALLCDSYVPIEADLREAMLVRFADGFAGAASRPAVERAFWRIAVQRKLKDAGRFVYIDRVRRNPTFLAWYGQSLAYVGRALARQPDLGELDLLFRRRIPGFPDHVPAPTPV